MAKNINSLQLLRSSQVYTSKTEAISVLSALTSQDGVAALARYDAGNGVVKTIVGFNYVAAGGTATGASWTIMDFDSTQIAAMQSAVGLNPDGTHAQSAGNYTSGADTIEGEIVALDTQVKRNADDIAEINSAITAMDAVSVSGESKVVIDVTQEDGQITASAANLTGVKLDGYTVGGDDSAKVAATDTLGQALGKLQGQINGMDLAEVGVEGSIITAVSETDGKVSATATPVKDVKLTGYVKDTTKTGDIAATDDIEDALSKLENKAAAITITNTDGSINVTTTTGGTDINVNIKSGEKVLAKDGDAGLYTDLDLVKITTGLPEEVKERYQLLATDDSPIGVNIDIPKDSHIVSITYDGATQKLTYNYIDASGNTQSTDIDMSELVLEAEFGSGVTVTDHVAHGVVDPTSEKDSNNNSFLTVDTAGFKVDGIKSEIDAKIAALDVTGDTAVAGQYVAAIEETDGVVAVKTRANVSEAVLNNYTKGSDATAIAATDTVNQALSKLENQVDAAKAAATTEVLEGTDTGNHLSISSGTAGDGHTTYTISLDDVASAAALTQEIADRGAADTELSNRLGDGVTTANTATAQLAALSGTTGDTSGTTSIEGAKRYADEVAAGAVADLDATVTDATSGNHVTITIEELNGKLVQSGLTIEENDIASAAALEAEITARKAVDGQNGQTYAVNANTNYISGASSLNDADVKLDAALKSVENKVDNIGSGFVETVKVNNVALPETIADGKASVNVAIAADNTAANSENAIVVATADANAQNPGAVTLQLGTLDAGFYDE